MLWCMGSRGRLAAPSPAQRPVQRARKKQIQYQFNPNAKAAAFAAQDESVTVVGLGVPVNDWVYANGVFHLSVPTEKGRS